MGGQGCAAELCIGFTAQWVLNLEFWNFGNMFLNSFTTYNLYIKKNEKISKNLVRQAPGFPQLKYHKVVQLALSNCQLPENVQLYSHTGKNHIVHIIPSGRFGEGLTRPWPKDPCLRPPQGLPQHPQRPSSASTRASHLSPHWEKNVGFIDYPGWVQHLPSQLAYVISHFLCSELTQYRKYLSSHACV